jgi:uncharacterized protein (TIGR03067 family)
MQMKLALCLAALLHLGAGAPQPQPAGKDREALQGKWHSESATVDGRERDGKKEWTDLVVDRDRISWQNSRLMGDIGRTSVVPYRYELHPATEPKGIDLAWAEGANKGQRQLGIYRLRGDTLTICIGPIGKGRPKAFESKEGTGQSLLRFQRARE